MCVCVCVCIYIYIYKDATCAVRLLTPLNLRSKTTYASQPPQ